MPSPEAWERIEALFGEAIELDGEERADFLRERCGDDAALLARIEALLEAHDALSGEDSASGDLGQVLDPVLASALLDDGVGELEPDAPVGRYRIVRRIGSGGMGVVYLARDPRLDRPVALKLLPRWRTADPAANRRLEAEARAASALDHPHIATVYEIGESEDGRRFIAMAWYGGGTLRERIGDAAVSTRCVIEIALQVADGLRAAHGRGIVHRDIKPENVVVGEGWRIVLVDFGLAGSAEAAGAGRSGAGTAAYMSPEQLRGEPIDPRADLWSLGAVLYELLAGHRPYEGRERAGSPPPLREVRPDVPAALAAAVHRLLDPDPERRFPSAEALLEALPPPDVSDRSAARRSAVRRSALATGAYVAVAAAAFAAAGPAIERYLLPGWFAPALVALLLLGLPLVSATALGSVDAPGRWGIARRLSWRRTAAGGALAILALAGVAAATVAWGVPRITEAWGGAAGAFEGQPWVAVTDFEAAEAASGVAMAAREALAVDLGQSRFVRLFGRSETASALRRMGLDPSGALDLETAREMVARAGGGAVLTGSVARVGRQYALTGRAFDSETGAELFAVRTAAGEDRLLGAVERLSREMRRRLGEERSQIRRSRPLPQVTTASLEALRLYALAEARQERVDYESAEALAAEAIRLDPGFAMAYRLASAAAHSRLDFGRSRLYTAGAHERRDRLTERERLHVEATYLLNVAFEPRRALEANTLLVERYPDDVRAWNNVGALRFSWTDDAAGAAAAFARALELDPHSGFAVLHAAHVAAIAGRPREGDRLVRRAGEMGMEAFETRWRLGRAFARGDVAAATRMCEELLDAGAPPDDAELCGSMDVAAGRLSEGIARLEVASQAYLREGRHRNVAHAAQAMAAAHTLRGEPEEAAARLTSVIEAVPSEDFREPDRYITRTNLRIHAAYLGLDDVAARAAAAYPPYADPDHWFPRYGEALVDAAARVAAGDGRGALRALDAGRTGDLAPIGWRAWEALLRGLAHEAVGQPRPAATHLRRATAPGYLLLPILTKDRILYPTALEALVRVERELGNEAGARQAEARLAALRAEADPGVADSGQPRPSGVAVPPVRPRVPG